jgi:lysophospholipase L1-like esterase
MISTLKLVLAAAILSLLPIAALGQAPDPSPVPAVPKTDSLAPANPALPAVFIVGDSTASYHPDTNNEGTAAAQGWGVYFPAFFDLSKVSIVNAARGGRSTRTYMTEGLWAKVLEQVRPHDIVLIQLGQNDVFAINDATRARGTIPGIGDESQEIDNQLTHQHEVVHSFGWYLRQYVRDTKAKGAIPIVMSLTPRDIWKDGRMERGAPEYRTWSAAIASQEHVDFVDISDVMAKEYEKLGQAKTATLYHQKEPVHVNTTGATLNAEWVVEGLKALPDKPVSGFLSAKGQAVAVTK